MSKHPLAITLGITGDMGFAAGCALRGVRKYSSGLDADILIYTDGTLPEADAALLRDLGADFLSFTPLDAAFPPAFVELYSPLCLSKLDCFLLLDRYERVIWLDADIAVQDDISELAEYGPFGMALEDPSFSGLAEPMPASINILESLPGYAMDAPNRNSGILVFHDSLSDPAGLRGICLRWLMEHAPKIKYMDQAALNMLTHMFWEQTPALVREIPYGRFNSHPYNETAHLAAIVHAFGPAKMWNDGLVHGAFPEWARDYGRWLASGGSPWRGRARNALPGGQGLFSTLCRFHARAVRMEEQARRLEAEVREKKTERGDGAGMP